MKTCKHGNIYDLNDENLKPDSQQTVIYTEKKDIVQTKCENNGPTNYRSV